MKLSIFKNLMEEETKKKIYDLFHWEKPMIKYHSHYYTQLQNACIEEKINFYLYINEIFWIKDYEKISIKDMRKLFNVSENDKEEVFIKNIREYYKWDIKNYLKENSYFKDRFITFLNYYKFWYNKTMQKVFNIEDGFQFMPNLKARFLTDFKEVTEDFKEFVRENYEKPERLQIAKTLVYKRVLKWKQGNNIDVEILKLLSEIYNEDYCKDEDFKAKALRLHPKTPTEKRSSAFAFLRYSAKKQNKTVEELFIEVYGFYPFYKDRSFNDRFKDKDIFDVLVQREIFDYFNWVRPKYYEKEFYQVERFVETRWIKMKEFLDMVFGKLKTKKFEEGQFFVKRFGKLNKENIENFKKKFFEYYEWDFENLKKDEKVFSLVKMKLFQNWFSQQDFFKEVFPNCVLKESKRFGLIRNKIFLHKTISEELIKAFREKYPVWPEKGKVTKFKGYWEMFSWCKRNNQDLKELFKKVYGFEF